MQDDIYILPSREPVESELAYKSNLPAQLTSFIGREQEVAQARALLRRPDVRLLTLTGPGGVGKTRLALQVATDLREDFVDGVSFVSLAPISYPDFVVSTIAQMLGLKEAGDQSLVHLLKGYLQDKHLLLLLDNFEQVVAAAPLLIELLQVCSHLKLIVTSRAVLHVSGEHEFPVLPLEVPDLKHLPDSDALIQYAAVALFLQRVKATKPDFHLTSTTARTIAEICVRLDGLPLAIELAAARIKLLPPQALLTRLDKRLQVLTSGARDMPARQQTLRNTIAWSYDLLTTEEQRLFRRLSIFVGDCTLEAVEVVCNAAHNQSMEMLEGVTSLLDKSLLQQVEHADGEPRLILLETIREYCLECLRTSGEMEVTQHDHAAYYLALAEQAQPELEGPQQVVWLERLEREHDNLRAAMQWLLEQREVEHNREMAWRLGIALARFWGIHGHYNEGRAFLERILARSESAIPAVRVKVLNSTARLIILQGGIDQAEELTQESLELCRQIGDTAGIAYSLYRLAHIAALRGNPRAACSLLEEGLALWREVGNRVGMTYFLSSLAHNTCQLGEYAKAQSFAEEGLRLCRGLGSKLLLAYSLLRLAEVYFVSQSDQATIRSLLEESLPIIREAGDKNALLEYFYFSGCLALRQGDAIRACLLLEQGLVLCRELRDPLEIARSLSALGTVATHQRDHAAARALYEESLAIARERSFKGEIPFPLEGLAAVVATQGELAWAARLYGAAEALRERVSTPIPPVYRADYDSSVAAACSRLGEKAFAAAWAEGRMMNPEQALAAKAMVPTPMSARTASAPPMKPPAYPAGLTTREVEVLRLVAQGLTDAQVAEQLVISRRTVNWYLTSIYSKIGVSSRSAATRYAIEQKLV